LSRICDFSRLELPGDEPANKRDHFENCNMVDNLGIFQKLLPNANRT
jgi:hypothetical protein